MSDENRGDDKSPLLSKTYHFNIWVWITAHLIWHYLPQDFKTDPTTMDAVLTLVCGGNLVLRYFTRGAIRLWRHDAKESNTQAD